jgi:hypothetical protein
LIADCARARVAATEHKWRAASTASSVLAKCHSIHPYCSLVFFVFSQDAEARIQLIREPCCVSAPCPTDTSSAAVSFTHPIHPTGRIRAAVRTTAGLLRTACLRSSLRSGRLLVGWSSLLPTLRLPSLLLARPHRRCARPDPSALGRRGLLLREP